MRKIVLLVVLIALAIYAYMTVEFKEIIPQANDAIQNSSLIDTVNTSRENRKNEVESLGY